ncbi:MAG: tetratricopeptide repeat protein [Elusimicrobia bacterium]|nr:tetratricopeptide repeat protein [Elusimicrobiota bacterium]
MRDATSEVRRWLLVVCFFVCPLLFFTNLTRNPYVTQITLMHGGIAFALALWAWSASGREGGWRLPRLPVALPLALFLSAWGASWLRAYLTDQPFFRPAIVSQGATNTLFLLVVCVAAFLLSAALAAEDDGGADVPLGAWGAFALAWGLLWCAFPQARAPVLGGPTDLWALAWDPYGAFVWALGLAGALWLTRRGRQADFLHLALCAGFLASAYGVLQYFNMEVVWPYTLNPYGGRAVSTFGNPNFLSTFNVALMPIALALFVREKSAPRRAVYGALFLTLEAALLATLTRSSWGGALVSTSALLLFPRLRARLKAEPRPAGLLIGAAVLLALLWPSSSMATAYTPTVIGRLTEVENVLKPSAAYSPFYQRVLIWTSAWLMGSGVPLLGKGGGLFELFYPFYQGFLLHHYLFFHTMRTHANNAHDEILENFSQAGLLGLGAYVALWAAFFESARRWAKGRLGEDPLWTGAVAACAGVLVDNLMNVSLHFAVPAFLAWWLAGYAMGRGAREGAGFWTWKGRPVLRRAAAALLLAAAAGVGWLQVRVWAREAWYFAGFKLSRRGDLPGAQAALERSRAWGPREVNALYELGNVYAREGRASAAAGAYREALDANAGYDEIYYNLATLYGSKLARPDLAFRFYETAWAINPLSLNVANALSAYCLQDPAHRLDEALDVLRETARNFPGNPNVWNNLGYALALDKRWAESEQAFTRALEIAPGLDQAARNLAGVSARAHRPPAPILKVLGDLRALDAAISRRDGSDKTLALAASIAAREPDLAKGRFLYGSLLLARGRTSEAIPELEAAARLEPSRAASRLNLGNAYLSAGRVKEAAAQFREALKDDPGDPTALQRLKELGLLK